MERWEGKVALVTGASAGIGAAIVEELVKHGMKVIGLARRVEKVEEIKTKLGSGLKGELFPLKGDVSKEEDILQTFQWIKEKFGTLHVLINNAAGNPKHWKDILDTNVMGLAMCSQQAFQLMQKCKVDDGHIIHINSIVGHQVPYSETPALNMYSPSKFAVTALTETMRQEARFLKTNIKISSVSPGGVDTEIAEASFMATTGSVPEDLKSKWNFPMLKSEDVADAVVYVLGTPRHVQIHELTIKPVGER